MKKIYIVLTYTGTILSKIVKIYTRREFSHVSIALDEDLKEMYPNYDKTRCFVTHSCADRELVDFAKAKVKELFHFDEILETVAGSIVTSHCGQGTLGVLFICE